MKEFEKVLKLQEPQGLLNHTYNLLPFQIPEKLENETDHLLPLQEQLEYLTFNEGFEIDPMNLTIEEVCCYVLGQLINYYRILRYI